MNNEMVTLNKEETSRTILDWSHDLRCCSCSLWLLLENMTSIEEEREHALITLGKVRISHQTQKNAYVSD